MNNKFSSLLQYSLKVAVVCLTLVLSKQSISAQITPLPDTLVCNQFILPQIDGVNLSSDLYYSLDIEGTNRYRVGDVIDTTSQLFIIDGQNDYIECFFLTVLQNVVIDPIDDVRSCEEYILPVIMGNNLSNSVAYFTEPDGNGVKYTAGNRISNSVTLYAYDGVNTCAVQEMFEVRIDPLPVIEKVTLAGCDIFEFPEIKGLNIPEKSYYIHIHSGQKYVPGDQTTNGGDYLVVASNENCYVTDSVYIRIGDFFSQTINDTLVCPDYELILDDVKDHHNLYLGNRPINTNTIRFSHEGYKCLVDSIPNENCSVQSCFNIEFKQEKEFSPTQLSRDTIYLCGLAPRYFPKIKRLHYSYDIAISEHISNNVFTPPSSGVFPIQLIYTNDPKCAPNDTMLLYIDVDDNCTYLDSISFSCDSPRRIFEIYSATPFGELYFKDGSKVENRWDCKPDTHFLITETNVGLYDTTLVYWTEGLQKKKVTGYFKDNSAFCLSDTLDLFFDISPLDSLGGILFWDVDYYRFNDQDTIFIEKSFLFGSGDHISITENLSFQGPLQPYSRYFMVVNSASFDIENPSYDYELSNDTIYFSTLGRAKEVIDYKLCYNDTLEIEGNRYHFSNRKDTIILSGASVDGCDSIIEIDLDFFVPSINRLQYEFCSVDDFIVFDCIRYDTSNTSASILFENAAANGCDSLVIIDLSYNLASQVDSSVVMCYNDSIFHKGYFYKSGDIIRDTLRNSLQCDSQYVNISLLSTSTPNQSRIKRTICEGDSINVFGKFRSSEGIYYDTLYSLEGCDSLIGELSITYYPKDSINLDGDLAFCEGDNTSFRVTNSITDLRLNGVEVTSPFYIDTPGTYNISGLTTSGCFVEETFNVTRFDGLTIETEDLLDTIYHNSIVLPVKYSSDSILKYEWSGPPAISCMDCPKPLLTSMQSGVYTIVATDYNNCASSATIHVSFKQPDFKIEYSNIINRNSQNDKNKAFNIFTSQEIFYDLKVFDRWGNVVVNKEKISSQNNSDNWIPKNNLEAGVYTFLLTYEMNNTVKRLMGSITIL